MKLTLQEMRRVTEDASSFIFSSENQVVYQSGQHLHLFLPHDNPDNRGKVRTFTLSSSPTEKGILTITTKRGVSSFKKTLFSLPMGTVVDTRGPSGTFTLDEDEQKYHIMLTGGIGITPFRSMLKYVFDKRLSFPITLLYSNKVPEEIVFKNELDLIAEKSAGIHIIYTITRPQESRKKWSGRVGRIDINMLREFIKDLEKTIIYTSFALST